MRPVDNQTKLNDKIEKKNSQNKADNYYWKLLVSKS